MKILAVGLIGLMFLLPACNVLGNYEVIIELTGDAGIEFNGWYVTTFGGLDSVEGTIPASWTVSLRRNKIDNISAYFQKIDQPGTMTGRLIVDGDTVQEKTVTNPSDALHLHWEQ